MIMLNKLNKTCQRELEAMEVAFTLLEEDHDEDTLEKMIMIQETATTMISDANKVLKKCESQRKSVNELVRGTMKIKGERNCKIAKINDQINDYTKSEKGHKDQIEHSDKQESELQEEKEKEQAFLLEVIAKNETITKEYNDQLIQAEHAYKAKMQQIQTEYEKKWISAHEQLQQAIRVAEKQCNMAIDEARSNYQVKTDHLKTESEERLLAIKVNYQESMKIEKASLQEKLTIYAEELTNSLDRNDRMYESQKKEYIENYKTKVADAKSAYTNEIRSNEMLLKRKVAENQIVHDNEMVAIQTQLKVDKKKHWFGTTVKEEESRKVRADFARTKLAEDNRKANEDIDKSNEKALKNTKDKIDAALKEKQDLISMACTRKEKNDQKAKKDMQLKVEEAQKSFDQLIEKKDDDAAKTELIVRSNKRQRKQAEKDKEDTINMAVNSKNRAINEANRKCNSLIKQFTAEIDCEKIAHEKITLALTETYQCRLDSIVKSISDHEKEIESQKSSIASVKAQQRQVQLDMIQCADKIIALKGYLKNEEDVYECLEIATKALENILITVKQIDTFWNGVIELCTDIKSSQFGKFCNTGKQKNAQDREAMLKSSGFKVPALHFVGKWVAIKDVCVVTNKQLTYTQNEVRRYIAETPNRDKARQLAIAMKAYTSKPQTSTDAVRYLTN